MTDVPAGWAETSIGTICQLVNGRAFKPSDWEEVGLPIIRIQNLNRPNTKFNFYSKDVDPRFLVENGDLLFAWSGTPGTSFGAHVWHGSKAILNQHIFNVHFDRTSFDRDFLRHAINQTLDEQIAKAHGGVGLRHVTKGKFEETVISIAPLAEQCRIVSKIDSLSSKSKRAREHLDHIPRLVEKYKQAVLSHAFKRWMAQKSAASPHARLESFVEVGPQNGIYLPKSEYGSGTAILRIQNYGFTGAEPVASWQRVRLPEDQQGTYSLQEGDLIINRVNSPSHLGKSLVITSEMVGAVFESNMMRLRLKRSVLPRFVHYFLMSDGGRRSLLSDAKWAVNQASINQGDVLSVEIPICDLRTQSETIRSIERAFAWIDRLAAEATSARKLIDRLDQAVLAKAFRGELVPQDPNDEPASVLLERIRAEWETAPAAKPRRGRAKRS